MSDVSRLLAEYAAVSGEPVAPVSTKEVDVAEASANKKADLTRTGYLQGAAIDVGLAPNNKTTVGNAYEAVANGNPNDTIRQSAGVSDYMRDSTNARRLPQTIGDSAIDVVNGALQGALGITGVAAGLVDDEAGAAVAGAAQDVGDFSNSLQSDALNDRRKAHGARNEVTGAYNQKLMDQEIEAGSGAFMANLRKVGRDFIDGVANNDLTTFTSGTANGVGSLLLGGVIGKGIKAAGGWAAARAAVGGAGPSRAGYLINKAVNAGAMPAAIGALEGGGAYNQTVNEVMGMSHEQLLEGSPDYVELLKTMTPEQAQAEIANGAGLMAAAIQAPVGVATGALVSKFEGAPFAVPSLKTAAGNILREGVEEGIQSGSGEISSNVGIQSYADQNQELLEGVGQAAGEGALFGMGTAGAIQGPTIAIKAPIDAAKWAGGKVAYAAKAAAAPIIALGERRAAAATTEANNASMDELTQANTELAGSVTPEVETVLRDLATTDGAEAVDYVEKVFQDIKFDPEIEAQNETNPVLAEVIGKSFNRFDLLRRVSDIVTDESTSPEDRADASVYLYEAISKYDSLLSTDLQGAVGQVDEGSAELKALRTFEDVVANFIEHPVLQASIAKAAEAAANFQLDESNPQSVATAAKIAQVMPHRSNLEQVDTVLRHASEGKIQLSPESKAAILETQNMLQTAQELTQTIEKITPALGRKAVNAVSHEVLLDPSSTKRAKSGAGHFAGIVEALNAGNRQLAGARLQQFMNFAQHMQNKVGALNANYAKGDGSKTNDTKYEQLSLGGKFQPSQTGMWVNPKAAKPVAFAQLVEAEARAITSLANRLATINSDLGVKPLAEVKLDAGLTGSVDEVVSRHRNGGGNPAQPAATPTAAPDAAAQQKSAPTDESAKAKTEGAPAVEATPEPKPVVEATPTPAPKAEVKPEPVAEAAQPAEAKTEAKAEPEAVEKKEETTPPTQDELVEEVDPIVAEPVTDPKTAAEAWPDLHQDESKGIVNWFRKAFKLAKSPISRLTGVASPIDAIFEAIQSQVTAEEFAGKLDNKIEKSTIAGFIQLFRSAGGAYKVLQKQLATLLAEEIHGTTFAGALTDGVPAGKNPVNTTRHSRTLNLVRRTEDGGFEYNDNLLESALLAGMNWLVTAGQRQPRYKDEQIARVRGISEEDVTQKDRDFFNKNQYLAEGVKSIATSITKYWGVSANKAMPVGYTQGIPEQLAKDILEAFEQVGLLKVNSYTPPIGLDDNGQKQDPVTYLGVEAKLSPEFMTQIEGFPDLIEQLVAIEPETIFHIGAPPATNKLSLFQKGSKLAKLKGQQRQALANKVQTPFTINMPMHDLILAVGEKASIALFGFPEAGDNNLNVNHQESLQGFNRTVTGAFAYFRSLKAQMKNKAELAGKSFEEMEVFFDYEFSRVNRMHMQGAYNPQSNKLVRELLMSTNDTVDLSDQNGKHFSVFMLAIAQHWGEKVHNQSRQTSVDAAQRLAETDYAQSIELLRNWVKGGQKGKFSDADIAVLKSEFGAQMAPGALHAALDYARYLEADAAGKADFKTSLYVEADGVTDGPVNGLIHLSTGRFSGRWIKAMAKGGLFFNSKYQSLSDYVNSDEEGASTDLYQAASNATFKALFKSRQANDAKNVDIFNQRRGLLVAMSLLMGKKNIGFDVELDLEDPRKSVTLERGIAKNPMTVTVYGSGDKGIASKFTHAMITAYYEMMSEGTLDPELVAIMHQLTTTQIRTDKKTGGFKVTKVDTKMPKDTSLRAYTFTEAQQENLKNNLLNLFVQPMAAGINEVIGEHVNAGKDGIRDAIQVHSLVLQHAFRTAINQKLLEKQGEPGWTGSHNYLSQQELDEITAAVVKQYHGLVDTGTQVFTPWASDNADVSDPTSDDLKDGSSEKKNKKRKVEISRASSDGLSSPLLVQGPGNAGVRGIPYMVIGPGDGQMIQNIAVDPNAPKGALYVFDGVNLRLTTAEADSAVINNAVYDGWTQGNPIAAVAKSFTAMTGVLGTNFIESMPNAVLEQLSKTLGLQTKDQPIADPADIHMAIIDAQRDLTNLGIENQARKNVLAKVNLNVDHMASAASPHVVSDKIQLTGTPDEMADQLNELYIKELNRLHGHDGKPGKVEASDEVAGREVSRVETESEAAPVRNEDGAPAATVRPVGDLKKFLGGLGVAGNLLPLVGEALQTAGKLGYQVAAGSVDQIESLLKSMGIAVDFDIRDDVHGLTHAGKKMIFLIDSTAETVVHELLHASTFGLVHSYYNEDGIDDLTQTQVDAIQRIDELMIEFLEINDDSQAYRDASIEINNRLSRGERAEAVNEFMAWTLSNQDLRQAAAKVAVKSDLAKIALRVLEALKQLLWGTKAPSVADDILSNLEFNTRVLLQTEQVPLLAEMMNDTLRHQSNQFGRSNKLKDLRVAYAAKLGHFLKAAPPVEQLKLKGELVDVFANADIITEAVVDHGFQMTGQEKSTFRIMVATFATEAYLDPNALARIQQLYSHVTKQLTVESFMSSTEADSQQVQDVDRYYAQQKFNSVMGDFTSVKDKIGRSALLSSFLALAMTNEEFAKVLSKIELPKSEKSSERTLDAFLDNLGIEMLDRFAVTLSGEGRNKPDVEAALEALSERLVSDAVETENRIQRFVTETGNAIDKGNTIIVNGIDRLSGKAADKLEAKAAAATSKGAKALFQMGEAITGFFNDSRFASQKDGAITAMNQMNIPRWLKEVFTEVVGRTESNASIYDMIKLVRSLVQQTRQQFREHLPKQVLKQFGRKLEKSELAAMTNGLAKVDIAALADGFSLAQILRLLTSQTQVASEVSKLEEELAGNGGTNWPLWQKKAKELAEYMVNAKASNNLLRNAYAVGHLFGEISPLARKKLNVSDDQIQALDQLISLYAMQLTDESTRDALAELVSTEEKGMDFVVSYLISNRRSEMEKVGGTSRAQINSFKGNYPTEGESGSSLIVAPDSAEARLKQMGFTKGEPYKTSLAERGAPAQSYYYSPVSGKAPYSQGILQNVRSTAGGVDPRTGFSIGIPMAGQIDDPLEVAQAARHLRHNGGRDTQALLPIYDRDGTIVAFERSMDPVEVARLKRNDNMAEILGIWVGRQVEEQAAKSFNQQLIGKLSDKYEEDKRNGKEREYVNLFSREALKDPIYRDAINLMTPEARGLVAEQFGEGEFWVRKDMINDAIGYRSASVGDVWTGTTRLHPEIQKNARNLAIGVFGQEAYKKLVTAEKMYQTVITDARVTIVVKSVVVPMANIISNVYHLASRGVPIQHIMKGFPKKTAEIDAFVKGRIRRLELEGLEKAAQGRNDQVALRRIQTELQSIRDANRRMSIWPLVKVGEFSSISDAAISHEEIQLSEGRLSEYMESLTSKLPDELKTFGRYAMVGRDTALFKGLQRAVEYGDFLAKAVLYDDLVIRQKKSPEEALARISEEFVNYDRLPGRGRGYLENMGLMWFWHFKLRSIKIAMSTLRHNPLHLLLAGLAPVPDIFGSVGTPVTDNALAIAIEGKTGWSIGPGQLINAHSLNPWINIWA